MLDRSYSSDAVKIVPAAGKVTSTMPWTRPAALTTRDSSAEAMAPTGSVGRCSAGRCSRSLRDATPEPGLRRMRSATSAGPAGLVGGAEPRPVVPVEVLVELHETLPVRVVAGTG